jgi:uracil-DNA glycosylase
MKDKKQYLAAMGIDVWQKQTKQVDANVTTLSDPKSCEASSDWEATVAKMDWKSLQETACKCVLCKLHKSRTQTVFGVGSVQADVMFIGEAPGANEDLQGEPFVGRAGMLLNAMLHSIGLQRSEVYIANVLKCRPPNNRDPLPDEVGCCTPYLKRQIVLIAPKLLVAVGRIAAQYLLNTVESMSKLRGKNFFYGDTQVPLIVTYHPAYLLRSPREKSKAYTDFLMLKELLEKFRQQQ